MSYFWLSFCDPAVPVGQRFLGACLVEADSFPEAVENAHKFKCNPGGEVVGCEVSSEYEHNIHKVTINKLLTRKEVEETDNRLTASTH